MKPNEPPRRMFDVKKLNDSVIKYLFRFISWGGYKNQKRNSDDTLFPPASSYKSFCLQEEPVQCTGVYCIPSQDPMSQWGELLEFTDQVKVCLESHPHQVLVRPAVASNCFYHTPDSVTVQINKLFQSLTFRHRKKPFSSARKYKHLVKIQTLFAWI